MIDLGTSKTHILHHVLYEMEMYLETFPKPRHTTLENNLQWEGHLLHLRNLIDFFTDRRCYPSDVIYSDILKDISLIIREKDMLGVKTAVNKSVSHLTMERIDPKFTDDAADAINKMIKVVTPKIKEFIDELKPLPSKLVICATQLDDEYIQGMIKNIVSMIADFQKRFGPSGPTIRGYTGSIGGTSTAMPS